ncbi:MAG: acetyltransferase [Sporocytophaga sp.]|uniref:acetyltransferase n=1 Tax=Sporocytophaga sp. TaxID=2231183 RepID=UPI001B01A9B3|nr:acetyltransferase [Sporocytophaga sp.]MBO9700878.1 acetyltransferase [Sporocytophaga sp.]
MKKLILIGGGGHCKSCIDVIESCGSYEIKGILEKDFIEGETILEYPILGGDELIPELAQEGFEFLITIGQFKSPALRIKLYNSIKQAGGKLATIIAASAIVSKYAKIGEGTIVMHGCILNASSEIGNNVIINTRALIEHDVKIGNHCHISTNTVLNGGVKVGDNCFIASSVMAFHGISIASNIVVGGHSTVVKDLLEEGVYIGNPAVFHK